MVNKKAGAAKVSRESFWREKLKQWRESGQSQAAFCRVHELNENSFSYWKMETKKRDLLCSAASTPEKRLKGSEEKPRQRKMEVSASTPAFVRFAISDCHSPETVETEESKARESPSQQVIAAEIVDASTGRRLRIFNGADQATVATLLSALSAV